MRQRIGAKLELHELRRSAFAALDVERRTVARRRPDAAAFPAAIRVVDPAVHGLGIKPHGIGDDKIDHLAVLQRDDRFCRPLSDRKSTRLNSSHTVISYAVFCLKKKKPQSAAKSSLPSAP